jgi:DNA-binding transcriptional LysR family regulator
MDPRRLITFRIVAHQRSFSRAAEKLSLSQPSVSHQVASLETEIGVRLLNRGPGGLSLTPAGEVLLEHADHISWRLDMAEAQIGALASGHRRQVRLGAFPTALGNFVPAAIGRLRAAGSDVQVLASEVTPGSLEEPLLSGEFDIAISYQDTTEERREFEGCEQVDLLQETFLIGMPSTHHLAKAKGPVPLRDFAEDDWILPSLDGFLAQACRDAGFEPRVSSITTDPIATRGLISREIGVGWVPSLLVEDLPKAVTRPVEGPMRYREIYALLPPGSRHPHTAEVLDALTATASEFDSERREP